METHNDSNVFNNCLENCRPTEYKFEYKCLKICKLHLNYWGRSPTPLFKPPPPSSFHLRFNIPLFSNSVFTPQDT